MKLLLLLGVLVPLASSLTERTENRIKELEDVLHGLSRQVMLQQFFTEERTRTSGNSGLKHIRVTKTGTRNYHEASHVSSRFFMAIHDHANYDRTVGLGEMSIVMNGVEFKTRHNDYKLRMPSRTSQDYGAMEDIPFPDVPPSVVSKHSVQAQTAEMREYFRAFKTQNVTHRDYRPYFKANLCYIEAAWTNNTQTLDEPFQSDRHQLDADGWNDLMAKARYTAYTGSKSVLENYATLPTAIMSIENNIPQYAQWNYRILCNPVADLPTSWFHVEDDLNFRFPNRLAMDKVKDTRAQRFYINKRDIDHYDNGGAAMDELMYQIPGKNNYPGVMHDDSFGMVMEDVRFDNNTLLNSGRYHRYFKTLDKGAMGIKSVHRGFADGNLWVAQTTHPQIHPMTVEDCHTDHGVKTCKSWTTRYSYALPLEVVYMTPLAKWNPYDIVEYPKRDIVVDHGRRTGQQDVNKAYNGTYARKFHYRTPAELFAPVRNKDPADTAKRGAGVLDRHGVMRVVESSGTRIVTPEIDGVGAVRLRYPIMPLHGEGSGVWKELNAMKEMTQHMNRYAYLFEERPGAGGGNGTGTGSTIVHYKVRETVQDPPGEHSHDFFMNTEEIDELKNHYMYVTTSEDQGHSHQLELKWHEDRKVPFMRTCDGETFCWDGHSRFIAEWTP